MNNELQEMLEHHQIRKTLSEYCHGCDRCDVDRMSSVYVEDSWDDHGAVQGSGADFTRIMMSQILTKTNTLSHMLGQSLIRVDGDEAGAETYFLAVSTSTNEQGEKMCNQLGGRFVDKLLRENDRWLIKHRTVLRDWSISSPITSDWTADAGLRGGIRSCGDPSYAVLGL